MTPSNVTQANGAQANVDRILSFWFGDDLDDQTVAEQQAGLWWGKNPDQDALIARDFGDLVAKARAGALDHWADTAIGRLAVIILIDQFSRNIFRDSGEAFGADDHALKLCLEGLERGHDSELRPIQRLFFYLPLEHAEDLALQQRCVTLTRDLAAQVPAHWHKAFASFADYAQRHLDVIAQFGRFPHRNALLGRPSTPQEQAYLATPGAGF